LRIVRDRRLMISSPVRDNGVVIIPNMAISQNGTYAAPPDWLDDPLFRAVTPAEDAERIRASFIGRTAQGVERAAETFRGMERSVARMKAAGVKFAFGTDAGAVRDHVHAFTDHRELDIMVRAGLTPMEAITAATSGSAELAGLADVGALTPGKGADFIVLDANPLDDIRNTRRISRVYLRVWSWIRKSFGRRGPESSADLQVRLGYIGTGFCRRQSWPPRSASAACSRSRRPTLSKGIVPRRRLRRALTMSDC
jgi:hypothetical protein